jgi:zinc protease
MGRQPSSFSRQLVLAAVVGVASVAAAQAPAKSPPPVNTPATLPPHGRTAAPKSATKDEADPWAGRTDLFVPPTIKPTTKVNLGPVTRTTLPNGMLLLVVPRHEIPSVEVTLAVKTPDTAEPLDETGVGQFTAAMLRKGTKTRTADQLSDAIDFVGGSIGAQSASGGVYVSCHARARDAALCMDLVSDISMHPTFPEAEMGEVRDGLLATVNQVKDNPNELARWHAANAFYGDDDPRGRPMSKRSIQAIDRKALVAFHDKWFAPNNAILAISGDVSAKTVRALIRKTFAAWKKQAVPPVTDPPARPMAEPAHALPVRLVDKPDATQSAVLVIGPGIRHVDPTFYATRLMNYTLGGGGFSSRLMQVVRSKGGKTYGVRSSFDAGREAGPFTASTFTRNAETTPTLKLVLGEIAKMKASGPTQQELDAAKSNLIGGYGLRLETGEDLAGELIGAEIDGLDPKYVTDYPARMMAVTLKDAVQAAQHLDPRALVIVGKASEVGPRLKKGGFAKIHVLNYLDPVSETERKAVEAQRSAHAEVIPAEAMEGKRLLELALKARGGQAALAKVQTLTMTGKGMLSMQGQQMPVHVETNEIRGKAMREDLDMGGMVVRQVFANGKGYVRQGERTMDMPPEMAGEMEKASFRDPNFIVLNATEPKAKVRGLKPISQGGKSYDVLEVISPAGDVTRVLLDPKSHLVARLEYDSERGQVHDELDDYKMVNGVSFPFKMKHEAGNQKVEIEYDKIVVNPKLSPDTFK